MPRPSVPQKVYRVTLSKTFEYHSAVIDEGNFLSDLHSKAVTDFVSKASKVDANALGFDCKLETELPFRVKLARDKDKDTTAVKVHNVDLDYVVNEIVFHLIEKKYGKLDFTKNPKIFTQIDKENPESKHAYNDSNYRHNDYYLLPEIETELDDTTNELFESIRRRIL